MGLGNRLCRLPHSLSSRRSDLCRSVVSVDRELQFERLRLFLLDLFGLHVNKLLASQSPPFIFPRSVTQERDDIVNKPLIRKS